MLGYQRLTSICLSLEEEPPASTANAMDVDGQQQQQQEAGLSTLSCTAINHLHKRAVRFSVQLDCDGSNSDDVLQADAHFRPLANKALLPAYLRVWTPPRHAQTNRQDGFHHSHDARPCLTCRLPALWCVVGGEHRRR